MKKLFTLILASVLTVATTDVFSQASDLVPTKSDWTYDPNTQQAKLELEFPSGTLFPVSCTIIVQDEMTEVILDTVIGDVMGLPKRIFFVDAIPQDGFFLAKYHFENGDGETIAEQKFNTFVSAVTATKASPTLGLDYLSSPGTLKVRSNASGTEQLAINNVLGQFVYKATLVDNMNIDVAALKGMYFVTILSEGKPLITRQIVLQ